MAVSYGGQPGATCMGIIPWISAGYIGRDEKELGFATPAVSERAGRGREQPVGRSPPKVPSQKGKEI